ncbi:phage tail tube protein [Prescottella equi]|uniref:phage tail tube protein n=1 Tax=Rhodococcus hoagii TaxID=43767 RepID=UPI003556468D
MYRRDDLPDAYQAETTVKWTDSAAGDTNALQEFSFTLSGRGKPEDITKPTAPETP